jgi:hypothetical protein
MTRTHIGLIVLLLVSVRWCAPTASLAQEPGERDRDERARDAGSRSSTYLPLDHWIYEYLDVLIARGSIVSLSPLVRPYRRIDIAEALLRARREGRLARQAQRWAEVILRELRDEVDLLGSDVEQGTEFHVELGAGLKALTHTHRDPLRPQGEEKLFPTLDVYALGTAPYVAGVLGLRWDNHLLNDPQFPDGRVIELRECDPIIAECAYRPQEAYLELQVPYVRLALGRLDRNWGLPGRKGLLVSDYPYSYDHIFYRFGSERISLTGLYAPFHDLEGDTTRHFASHRFDWRIRDNLHIALGESVVFGGEHRDVEFSLINPILPWEISGRAKGSERNSLGMAEIWFRAFEDVVTYGAFLVDNTAVVEDGSSDERKGGFTQFAGALGVQVPDLAPTLSLRGDVTVASSLAYRSRVGFFEYYTLEDIGLALDKTDAVLLSIEADWFPALRLILQPRVDVLWKGEDDIRDPFPPGAFTEHDRLLVGVVETTIRPALRGRYHFRLGEVRWDLGLNFVKNDDHVEGRDWRLIGVGNVVVNLRKRF